MTLTQQQKDLLIGTLLGDGNLQTATQGQTWRYRALQKAAHKAYLFHKYQILQNLCTTGPIFGETYDDRTGTTSERWYFNTNVDSSLRFYGNMFYTYDANLGKMVKDVPKNIEKYLTPAAVAYWYMDDGSLKWKAHSNAMRVSTECYTKDGVNRLRNALLHLYGIPTGTTKKTLMVNGLKVNVGKLISIPEDSSTTFRQLIEPHLVDCMRYKVSDGNYGSL